MPSDVQKNTSFVREPTWELLSVVGNNKLIGSSFLWFIMIPIVAKSIQNFKNLVSAGKFSNEWLILLDSVLILPFEWKILYYSSALFVLANVLYLIFCPKLIQEFNNWGDYEERGTGLDGLIYFYSNWLKKKPKILNSFGESKTHEDAVDEIIRDCSIPTSKEDEEKEPWLKISCIELSDDCELQQVYWIMTRQMLRDKPLLRWFIGLLYLIGFSLVIWVLFGNFRSVMLS